MSTTPGAKKRKATGITIGSSRHRHISSDTNKRSLTNASSSNHDDDLRSEFMNLFHSDQYRNGISNNDLKKKFGEGKYKKLVAVINELMKDARLTISRGNGEELIYSLVSDELASKLTGLDMQGRLVYQTIEKAGDVGIWTRDIRNKTNIQQQALTKIFKIMETRKLIKPIKSVTNKSKKLYMLYDLAPSKEVTGGPWYTELEFDHEFISELRNFILMCIRRMNGAKGVTMAEIGEKMKLARVSRVELSQEEVQQLVQTLAFDYMIEQKGFNAKGEALFIEMRTVNAMSDFRWWDEVLAPDFHFRTIKFEDDVVLSAHEPHHHTA